MESQGSDRKASKGKFVRFNDSLDTDDGKHKGPASSQSEALAECLVPRLTRALRVELRSAFAEETALWAEQFELLRRQLFGDPLPAERPEGIGTEDASRRGMKTFSHSVDAKWSQHLEKVQEAEQVKEQQDLQQRRLCRMIDEAQSVQRSPALDTHSDVVVGASEPRSACGGREPSAVRSDLTGDAHSDIFSETIELSPRRACDKRQPSTGEAWSGLNAQGARLDSVRLNFLDIGLCSADNHTGLGIGANSGPTLGLLAPKSALKLQRHPAQANSCPELPPMLPEPKKGCSTGGTPKRPHNGDSSAEEGSEQEENDEGEETHVTKWEITSTVAYSEAESIGDVIRRNRQAAKAATMPAAIQQPLLATNPFANLTSERNAGTIENSCHLAERYKVPDTDIASVAKAYTSTGSQSSMESCQSKGSILTVASVTTARSATTHPEEPRRSPRKSLQRSRERFAHREAQDSPSSPRGDEATAHGGSDCDRARMLGVAAKPGWMCRVSSTKRDLSHIEQDLCAELFRAQELLPKRGAKAAAAEGAGTFNGRNCRSRASPFRSGSSLFRSGSSLETTKTGRTWRWPFAWRPVRSDPTASRGAAVWSRFRSSDSGIASPGSASEPSPDIMGAPEDAPPLLPFGEGETACSDKDTGCEGEEVSPWLGESSSTGNLLQQQRPSLDRQSGAHNSQARESAHASPACSIQGSESLKPSRPSIASNFSRLFSGSVASVLSPTSTSSAKRRSNTVADLRQKQEKQLVQAIVQDVDLNSCAGTESTDSMVASTLCQMAIQRLLLILPRLCGMEPWCSHNVVACALYQWTMALLALGCSSLFLLEAQEVLSGESLAEEGQIANLASVLDVVLALGSLLSLLSCGLPGCSKAIYDVSKLLNAYARKRGILEEWQKSSMKDLSCTLVLGVCAVSLRLLGDHSWRLNSVFAFVLLLHFGITSHLLHICRCLTQMVDSFCDGFVERPDFAMATQNWNAFQAICRTACGAIQACFIVEQATATAVALLCITEVTHGVGVEKALALAPMLLLVLGIVRTSVWAAAISDRCSRVPMLINALSVGGNLNRDRMYIVEYIVHSRAGFYIFDVRLTSAAVLKAFYVACAVTLGLASQML